ncbi:MAG: hypothetical protein M1285_03340 [Candidatus Thermoplasmatota archaeon]|jgi:signal-transduction protein with cAMP-binding, CBS, and nucleotidyltransferase domain|nr:hypothetical protein [Candidatus Thermoplasmatota archaeon]WMT44907.1 MAG: hypothetical protein RE469_01590 [Cuniculiplasma divulgatum]
MIALYILQKANKGVFDQIASDDILGRQTLNLKEAANYIPNASDLILYYEGSDDGRKRLEQLFGNYLQRMAAKTEEDVIKQIKEEDSRAEDGMGFLFG